MITLKETQSDTSVSTVLQDFQSAIQDCNNLIQVEKNRITLEEGVDYPEQSIQKILQASYSNNLFNNYDIMRTYKLYPWNYAKSVIYDYEFRPWTKLGSGTIEEDNGKYYFTKAGLQLAKFSSNLYDPNETDANYPFNDNIYCCEFEISIEDDATNRWIIMFYTSLSGTTSYPFIGIFWWGANNENVIGLRRRTSNGGTITNAKGYLGFRGGLYGRFLFVHDPEYGEYLFIQNPTGWELIAEITTKTTLNFTNVRVNANANSTVTAYTMNFNDFRLGTYPNVANSSWNYIPHSYYGSYWESWTGLTWKQAVDQIRT